MKMFILLCIVLLVGTLIPVQLGLNSQLAQIMKSPMWASFISFLVGAISVGIVMCIMRPVIPSIGLISTIPWHLYLGGVIGGLVVTVAIFTAPEIGAANTIIAALVGQLLASLLIDHYGLFNVPVIPIDWPRVLGAFFLLLGLYLIQRQT